MGLTLRETKYCKKCDKETIHNVKSEYEEKGFLTCRPCIRVRSKAYKRENWESGLALELIQHNLNPNISKDDIKNQIIKQKMICALSGETLVLGDHNLHPKVDTIGFKNHQSIDSIKLISHKMYRLKSTYTFDEFFDLCKKIVNNIIK